MPETQRAPSAAEDHCIVITDAGQYEPSPHTTSCPLRPSTTAPLCTAATAANRARLFSLSLSLFLKLSNVPSAASVYPSLLFVLLHYSTPLCAR